MNDKFDYKKSLGQNFLIDNNIINNIIKSIDAKTDDLIIEVGPGEGAITSKLCNFNCKVYSFEIDKRLMNKLLKIENENIKVIFEDFLKIDLNKFLQEKKYSSVIYIGNLPYYITTPIITKIINEGNPEEMIIMVQKEVGNRFMAKPSTREYSSISVYLQYYFDISKVCLVSKNCFYPVPKVDSIVIKMKKIKRDSSIDINKFNELIRAAFQYKRKNLNNNLKKYNLLTIEKYLITKGKSLKNRAEELTIDEFVELSKLI